MFSGTAVNSFLSFSVFLLMWTLKDATAGSWRLGASGNGEVAFFFQLPLFTTLLTVKIHHTFSCPRNVNIYCFKWTIEANQNRRMQTDISEVKLSPRLN